MIRGKKATFHYDPFGNLAPLYLFAKVGGHQFFFFLFNNSIIGGEFWTPSFNEARINPSNY